jgi:hypothetical protein
VVKTRWIGTRCIDKTSNLELAEVIDSMFHWYREAELRFIYLADPTKSASIVVVLFKSFSNLHTAASNLLSGPVKSQEIGSLPESY